jgi:large subunit ribosomal protein L2
MLLDSVVNLKTRNKKLLLRSKGVTNQSNKLIKALQRNVGRNNRGVITIRHRGGGHKRLYRVIDFNRNKLGIPGKVISIEYDPNRNCKIALIYYGDGEKRYILQPKGLRIGDSILTKNKTPVKVGNALLVKYIPLGVPIHNIEITPRSTSIFCRAAGSYAQIIAKEGSMATIRLPSKEIRLISVYCFATIGQVGNTSSYNRILGKAGVSRWLGWRPTVRGSAQNPVDHKHGGGEGKAPVGHPHPFTPWGKPARGVKTRKGKKYSNSFIIRTRKGKLVSKAGSTK